MEVINTLVPSGCAVRLIDLPYSVDELVSLDEEGFASIYLNARHSREKQKKSLRHALRHLAGDDFYNEKPIRQIEREADGVPSVRSVPEIITKAPPRRSIERDMATLRRIGIITDNWRDDPLLNLPEYNY